MYKNFFKFFARANPTFKNFKFNPLLSLTLFSLAAFHSKKYVMDDEVEGPNKLSLAKHIA